MQIKQRVDVAIDIALIDASLGATITEEVLGRHKNAAISQEVFAAGRALLPDNQCSTQFRDQIGVF